MYIYIYTFDIYIADTSFKKCCCLNVLKVLRSSFDQIIIFILFSFSKEQKQYNFLWKLNYAYLYMYKYMPIKLSMKLNFLVSVNY